MAMFAPSLHYCSAWPSPKLLTVGLSGAKRSRGGTLDSVLYTFLSSFLHSICVLQGIFLSLYFICENVKNETTMEHNDSH